MRHSKVLRASIAPNLTVVHLGVLSQIATLTVFLEIHNAIQVLQLLPTILARSVSTQTHVTQSLMRLMSARPMSVLPVTIRVQLA